MNNNGNKNSNFSLLIRIIGVIVGLYLIFLGWNIITDNASYNAGYNNTYYNR